MMKLTFFLLIIISALSIKVYGQTEFWDDLSCSKKAIILENCKSEYIKKFYEDEFAISDDNETEKLLIELSHSNDTILPLAFHLFNKISKMSDGGLAEMMGKYYVEFIARHPKYIITFFSKERSQNLNNPIYVQYARTIGYELYFKNKGTSNLRFTYAYLKEKLFSSSNGDKINEETFAIFWSLVDETIRNME